MQNGKIIVGITQGDSNGIGYEVIIKALADPRILEQFTPVIYGSSKLFGFYRKTIPEVEQMDTNAINSASEAHAKRVNIVNCLPDSAYAEPGQATAESASAAIKSLETAVRELKEGLIDVLVTGPINKKAMSNEGFGFPGHTEYIQNAFGAPDSLMFMVSHLPESECEHRQAHENHFAQGSDSEEKRVLEREVTDDDIVGLEQDEHQRRTDGGREAPQKVEIADGDGFDIQEEGNDSDSDRDDDRKH